MAGREEDGSVVVNASTEDAFIGHFDLEPIRFLQWLVGRHAQDPLVRVYVRTRPVQDEPAAELWFFAAGRDGCGKLQDAEPVEFRRHRRRQRKTGQSVLNLSADVGVHGGDEQH